MRVSHDRHCDTNITMIDFMYGTAWKEEKTQPLVVDALNAGFVAIDTANQRKHYYEDAVGLGIHEYLKHSGKKREDLFIQTKYTYTNGQDKRLPYDPKASIADQVRQSFESSLKHLGVDYIDSYILHGPYDGSAISQEDAQAWQVFEELQAKGKTKFIGVSNHQHFHLEYLYNNAKIKPTFIQNRCYAHQLWDKKVRDFCNEHKIHYQGFSLLTANYRELMSENVQSIAKKYNKTIPQVTFRFARQVGMIPLTGTSKIENMKSDLDINDFELSESEVIQIERVGYT